MAKAARSFEQNDNFHGLPLSPFLNSATESKKSYLAAAEIYATEGQFITATKYITQLAEMCEREGRWDEACEAWENAASLSESDHAPR